MLNPDDLQDIVDESEILARRLLRASLDFDKPVTLTAFINDTVLLFKLAGCPKQDFMRTLENAWDLHAQD